MRKVQVYLDDETYQQLLDMKRKGKIKSLSEFLRSIILLYLTSRPTPVKPVKMVEEQLVVYRKRRLVKPVDERRKLWVEVQKELKKVFAKR